MIELNGETLSDSTLTAVSTSNVLVERALSLIQNQNHAGASTLLDEAVASGKPVQDLFLLRSVCALSFGDVEKANFEIKRELTWFPNNFAAINLRGTICQLMKKQINVEWTEPIPDVEPEKLMEIARWHLWEGRPEAALKHLNVARSKNSKLENLRLYQSRALFGMGDRSAGFAEVTQEVRLFPGNREAWALYRVMILDDLNSIAQENEFGGKVYSHYLKSCPDHSELAQANPAFFRFLQFINRSRIEGDICLYSQDSQQMKPIVNEINRTISHVQRQVVSAQDERANPSALCLVSSTLKNGAITSAANSLTPGGIIMVAKIPELTNELIELDGLKKHGWYGDEIDGFCWCQKP